MPEQSKEMYDFKKQLEALKQFKGRGTELISVYMPPGYPVADMASKLREEFGQAGNIKSKSTQKNVQAALEKIMHFIKGVHKAPANGIAIFCGNVTQTEGKSDMRIYSVVPPVPLTVGFYRCESTFVIEPLEEMLGQTGCYGLVVMDGKEATVATLKGKQIKVIKKMNSTAHQKVQKGGQSAARYDRLHVEGVEYYYKRVGASMDAFLSEKNFKGIIVGGPGPAKEDFLKMKPFNYQLKILGMVDTGYTDEFGLREILEKSGDIISEQESIVEKKLLDSFMKAVSENGLVAYGYNDIKRALLAKQVEKLLVSEGLELHWMTFSCEKCGKTRERMVEGTVQEEPCECGGVWRVKSEIDIGNELIGIAEEQGVPVEMVSTDTAEGAQFFGTFKGVGAFLRYK
ncbi:peptide chain release factor 1 [Candidatus Micrarchaeota archaeon CG08_land_8_20_14_0_20_59_11]|nr:MAG: peptide chain release factor 1 [Candidatus Micrarchaeota archaeon CG08_land_8_20_14_0_20_59_11]